MIRKNAIVVGGGLGGLFASILLTKYFEKVYVIEKEDQCGGLLRSVTDKRGVVYDQGTHVPDTTLVKEIDEILFGAEGERNKSWTSLGPLKSGNYFCRKWNLENPTADARCLPDELYSKGVLELLGRTRPSIAADIATYLTDTIGPTFTTHIAAPVVKKLYDSDPANLTSSTSVSYFGLSRVIALTPEVTNKLKELEVFDTKLGYHTQLDYDNRQKADKQENNDNLYPRENVGVFFWIERLLKIAETKGVVVLNGDYVEKIEHNNKFIKRIYLGENKDVIDCDFLCWTVPPVLALRAAGITVPKAELIFRTASIFHFSYDLPLQNSTSHYLWNWDGDFRGFRITLYPNMQPHVKPALNNLTIEALSSPEEAAVIMPSQMHDELVRMGLVSKDAKILSELRQTIHDTFPVPTFAFEKAVKDNHALLTDSFKNIFISGRFGGKAWFHRDVAKEIYFNLQNRFN